MCEEATHTAAPVGAVCAHCDERIEEGDAGVQMPCMMSLAPGDVILLAYHLNCHLREVVGSVGHQMGKCICHGVEPSSAEHWDDPPGLTRREAADEAVRMFYETERQHRIIWPR